MNAVSASPYSVVKSAVPIPNKTSWIFATRHGARKVLRWSSRVGVRSSIDHRSALTVRRVIQNVPNTRARTISAGDTPNVSHAGASVKMLGTGKATATSNVATPMKDGQDDLNADPPAPLTFGDLAQQPGAEFRRLRQPTALSSYRFEDTVKSLCKRFCWRSSWRQPNLPSALDLRLTGCGL